MKILKKVIFKKTDFSEEYRYIIYSPTFRTDDAYQYNVDFEKLVRVCEEQVGGKWKVLYRLHPNLLFRIKEQTLPDVCIDVCKYSDMQELIAISDFMITDYSSCMFDMMYMKKPCLLYMSDFKEYTERERNLYFNIKELPFLKVYTEDEALLKLKNVDLSDLETFKPNIKAIIKGILEREKTKEKIAKKVETEEKTVVEKPAYSRKRNYKAETE